MSRAPGSVRRATRRPRAGGRRKMKSG
jgi:hypothetical protein